ncbi:hypothetical protein ACFY2J_21715 [Streptomyces collinus]|uniref:hypothetical protein n=1 Tax=Streptomyces collinus TaxID=42684 RepID=UPI0036A7C8BA
MTDQWLADEQERLDGQQAQDNIKTYSRRNGQLMALAGEWAKTHDPGEPYYDPKEEITRSAQVGISHAAGMSGERPS